MAVRKIIHIDEEKCNGCGLCVPNCAEGAIQIINGKAKLVKDSYCDGLGACLGHCPQGALKMIEREAEDFNEEEAMKFAEKMKERKQHRGQQRGGCPGSSVRIMENSNNSKDDNSTKVNSCDISVSIKSQLKSWPVQLNLVPVNAPFFDKADLLVTADCVPFAYANYHLDLLKGKVTVIGCPKLDDIEHYISKLTAIISGNNLKSITVAFMEVPCCSGIVKAVDIALERSGKSIPVSRVRVGIGGEVDRL